MNVEEAIRTAIDYETRVRDFYGEAAEKIDNPDGKRIMELLSKDEQMHLDYLNDSLRRWTRDKIIDVEELKSTLPSKGEVEEKFKKAFRESQERVPSEDEIATLKKAVEIETETSQFYKGLVEKLDDKIQKMFERFVEMEEGHLAIVKGELDSVRDSGFWFDFREFDL